MCLTEEDITNIIRYYDRNVDGEWNFKEFIDFTSPKLQY
jgi:Ca2+-binding EF-hand superfamily protein